MNFFSSIRIKTKILLAVFFVFILTAIAGLVAVMRLVSINNDLISSGSQTGDAGQVLVWFLIFAVIVLVVAVLTALAISSSIVNPINDLSEKIKSVESGKNTESFATNERSELSAVMNSIAPIIENYRKFKVDIGDLNSKYNNLSKDYSKFRDGVNNFAEGKFFFDSADYPESIQSLKKNINHYYNDVKTLAELAGRGVFKNFDTSKYANDWAIMAKSTATIINSTEAPLNEMIKVLNSMSSGNFSARMDGNYQGTFNDMKTALNNSLNIISKCISEISGVLNQMSNQDFDVAVKSEFIGDFAPIKLSLNKIIDSFNDVLQELNISAEQVAAGARMISESSMTLASGATKQSTSVDGLVATISGITVQTRQNAENANNANQLALSAKEIAEVGNSEMNGMLNSMSEINAASANISSIIKVIDDIAFQTNLLALNAAVEAARAGEFGKGFAVVAEEVRNLATRSKDAASQTTELIEGSVRKVSEGTKIANQTAETLSRIVTQIEGINNLIADVAAASDTQERAFSMINEGISNISEVAQMNTSTSEEQASSAEELSSQSEVFKNMVMRFKLRKSSTGTSGIREFSSAGKGYDASKRDIYAASSNMPRTSYKSATETAKTDSYSTSKPATTSTSMAKPISSTPSTKSVSSPSTNKVSTPAAAKPVTAGSAMKPATSGLSAKPAVAGSTLKPATTGTTVKPSKTGLTAKPPTAATKPAATTSIKPTNKPTKSLLSENDDIWASPLDGKNYNSQQAQSSPKGGAKPVSTFTPGSPKLGVVAKDIPVSDSSNSFDRKDFGKY